VTAARRVERNIFMDERRKEVRKKERLRGVLLEADAAARA